MKMTLWQAERLAKWMRAHDDPADQTLNTAHVKLTDGADGTIEAVTEAGARLVMWHDGSDVTDEYPPTPIDEEIVTGMRVHEVSDGELAASSPEYAAELKRRELARLEGEFAAAGGRGVELAERIDALRAELSA